MKLAHYVGSIFLAKEWSVYNGSEKESFKKEKKTFSE